MKTAIKPNPEIQMYRNNEARRLKHPTENKGYVKYVPEIHNPDNTRYAPGVMPISMGGIKK